MIIRNLIVGTDKYGHKIECGDICKFKIKLQRPKKEAKIEELKGMVIYDEDSYAFAFETLDDYAPLLLMYCAELHSIEKIFSSNLETFENIPNGERWKEIFIKEVNVL